MDIQKINNTIDSLPVCADGKKAVRALVEEITGKKLETETPLPLEPRPGMVFRSKNSCQVGVLARKTCLDSDGWTLYGVGIGGKWFSPYSDSFPDDESVRRWYKNSGWVYAGEARGNIAIDT